jgi:hypothetical protein
MLDVDREETGDGMKWFLSRVVDASVNTLLILRKTIRPG